VSELADRALQEFAEKEPDDPPLQAHEAARLCRWFLAGFAAGQASRTPRPYTAKMLECAKRWRQHLKLTDDYEKLLDGFINEVESK